MAEGSKHTCLTIEKMPEGGFVVREGFTSSDPNRYRSELYAASRVVDALSYIGAKLDAVRVVEEAKTGAMIGGALGATPAPRAETPQCSWPACGQGCTCNGRAVHTR